MRADFELAAEFPDLRTGQHVETFAISDRNKKGSAQSMLVQQFCSPHIQRVAVIDRAGKHRAHQLLLCVSDHLAANNGMHGRFFIFRNSFADRYSLRARYDAIRIGTRIRPAC
jgi:hypothetical protein